MGEIRESYQDLIGRISSMGSIKQIVNNKELLLQILTYSGDRHLVSVFYEMLNKSLERGEVLPEDLENLRSGWLAASTIYLKDSISIIGRSDRDVYPFEIGDKLNYLTTVNDTESQIASFTRPEIIGALAKTSPNPNEELTYWEQSFSFLSIDARLKITEEVLRVGNREKALQMLEEINNALTYEREYYEERNKSVPGRW